MKRNAGLTLAAVLAVTAAVSIPASRGPGAAIGPAATVHVETAKPGAAGPHRPKPVSDASYTSACTAYDATVPQAPPDPDRSLAKSLLDTFFGSEAAQNTAQTLLNEPGVQYAIALTADPRHTNLSLVFDRQMAVIQQAAQDESYTYDSSWLPWSSEKSSYALLADQEAADDLESRREACPGLLLFRRSASENASPAESPYRQALVVLVVGEQPTGGLNVDQWRFAAHWLAANASPKDARGQSRLLRVLGPSFSGSLVSLGRELGQLYPAANGPPASPAGAGGTSFAAKFPEARILSGSVSDCASIRWFQQLQWPAAPGEPGKPNSAPNSPAVVFGSFQENDDREIYALLNYLDSQGTPPNDTAILSEDETAYSGAPPAAAAFTTGRSCAFVYPADHRPVRLFFPRDISALRNAYEKQAIFATSGSGQGAQTLHPILQEGSQAADEGGNPSDTIQAYSHNLTPVAQEAVLYGIVSYMRAHHTRYVLLRCTNPLDFLFLTRFFHRAYAEGRIVTVGSDLLFRREIDTTEFRGVLALSNYSLLPRNQHWSMLSEHASPLPGHAHRAFETGTVEGAYLAARYLFTSAPVLARPGVFSAYSASLPLMELLPEYADPFWLHRPEQPIYSTHAPTWLTVLGRDGYWPVAVLNDEMKPNPDLGKAGPPPSTMIRLTSRRGAHYDLAPDGRHFNQTLRSKLPLPWTICASLALLLLVYQLFGMMIGDQNASQGLFSVFRKVAAPSQDLLLGINCAFATILLGAPLSIGLTFPAHGMFLSADLEYSIILTLGVVMVLLISAALLFRRGAVALGSYLCVTAALAAGSLAAIEATLVSEGVNQVPLFYRLGHVTAGVAPLLPVLFLFTGFYLWTWHAMAGNVLLCNGRPVLPKLERIQAKTGFLRWYWILLGNPVEATGRGSNRLNRSQIRMSQELGKRMVEMASPVSVSLTILALPLGLLAGALVYFHSDLPLLSLEGHAFALWLNLGLLLAFLLISAEASRLLLTWVQLRALLSKLNRLRIRRTFARLRAIEVSSLWSVSGSVQRVQYLFFSHQLEAACRLAALTRLSDPGLPNLHDAIVCGKKFDRLSARKLSKGPRWDQPLYRPSDHSSATIRDIFSDAVAEVYNRILWPWWGSEGASLNLATSAAHGEENQSALELPLSEDAGIRTAEEFVCFQYIAFIQNILARMRTMTLSMVLLFIAVSLAISFYPFVPRTQISLWMIVNLVLIGSAVLTVYAGMDRDDIISYITNTRPGRLSGEFWLKSATFLAGPVIGIITTQFPAVADSILAWVQPGLDAIK